LACAGCENGPAPAKSPTLGKFPQEKFMTTHTPPPQLCADCLSMVHALAETGPADDRVIKRCPHNGVIAVAAKRGGSIVNWHLEGPLTDAEADAIGAKILTQFAMAGMVAHEITKQ
jgi:hypothetical protein